MRHPDASFAPSAGLHRALALLTAPGGEALDLPRSLPESGLGEMPTLELLSGHVLGRAAALGAPTSLALMDPPTPWITWAMALWNARLNQNMLHAMTSPFATEAEAVVLSWLAPSFGMQGGHFCAGSSIANLTGIWAARDAVGVKRVVASEAAHLSVRKACHLLGLELVVVPADAQGRLDRGHLPNLDDACLVLTAGTTATDTVVTDTVASDTSMIQTDTTMTTTMSTQTDTSATTSTITGTDTSATTTDTSATGTTGTTTT